MPHRLSHRRLHDDEVRASIRKHGNKISRKFRIPPKRLEQAQSDLLGNIVLPGDLAYEKVRRIWNVFFNPRPALVIQCQAEKDVRIALELGREFKIPVTLRSGGHTTAGYSGGTGTLVIDLKGLDDVAIDAHNLTATVSCGSTFGKMNAALDARGVHLQAGECDDVRMGGFMQGGGYGFTSRTFGMHSDVVTSFRMMLANGRTVTASPDVNSDLFWAVRGGTGGNFGVLLNAEYKIQKLDKVYGWSILWPLSTAGERKIASEAMMAIQKDFFRTAPPEFNIQIAVCYQPTKKGGKAVPQLVVRGLYVGTEKAGKAAIAPIRKLKGAKFQYDAFESFIKIDNKLLNFPYDIPYIPFEKKGQPPEDKQARNVARDLTPGEWQKILDHFVTSPNKWSYLYFEVYGGKINDYPLEDSAFIHRDCAFCTALDIFYYKDDDKKAAQKYLKDWCKLMEPMWNGHIYPNYPKTDVPDYRKHYWGRALDALIGVKKKYDPDTFFRFEQMVSPYPGQKPKPVSWPPKVADALKQRIVYEDGKP
jgi:FAD/FMN-containing dehydrogenase